jgi:hypothetical protein
MVGVAITGLSILLGTIVSTYHPASGVILIVSGGTVGLIITWIELS